MKLTAFILSFLFIVLSIQPAFVQRKNTSCTIKFKAAAVEANSSCSKKACPSGKSASKKVPKEPLKNPCDNCNPLMSCNGCGFIPANQQVITPAEMQAVDEATNGYNNSDLSDYSSDFWHPPELFFRL